MNTCNFCGNKLDKLTNGLCRVCLESDVEVGEHRQETASAVDTIVSSAEWISVEDRLPDVKDDIEDVLIAFGSSVKSGVFIKHDDDIEGRFYCDGSNYHTKGVTHWMPAPKNPTV